MEDKKMLDIIHSNCKKEQIRKAVAKQQYKKEQQCGAKWNKRLVITGITCLILEILILVVERMI